MINSLKFMAATRQRYLKKLTKSDSSHFSKAGNKVRRFILCLLGKDYVKEQEKLRFGDCVLCGKCCQLVIPCPFLEGQEKTAEADHLTCLIYHKGRPPQCVAFPIDERDLADVNFQCGYYFLDAKREEGVHLSPSS